MKKTIALLLVIAACISMAGVTANAFLGTGYALAASEVKVIKTGLYGQKLTFSDIDFKQAYALTDFESVTVDTIPASTEGTLLLAGRRVKEGQRIKRRNVAALIFVPASDEVKSVSFQYTLCYGSVNTPGTCEMKFIDKLNYAPKTPEERESSLSLKTQSEISVYARLEGTDPEGDSLEYIIAMYPKNGTLTFTDKETGAYRYTPNNDFTGYDCVYHVAGIAHADVGKVSEEDLMALYGQSL